jgi:hypothetical protein
MGVTIVDAAKEDSESAYSLDTVEPHCMGSAIALETSSDEEPPCQEPIATGKQLRTARMCHHFAAFGSCNHSESCDFAHSAEELQCINIAFKTKICHSWAKHGSCRFGVACRFEHSEGGPRMAPDSAWPMPLVSLPRKLDNLKAPRRQALSQSPLVGAKWSDIMDDVDGATKEDFQSSCSLGNAHPGCMRSTFTMETCSD